MYQGYLELGGVPLINSEATEAYIANLSPSMGLRAVYRSKSLHVANGEEEYRTPVLDAAPWVNPNDPTTFGFYGLYPISIEGVDNIPLTAGVTEYLGDGGSTGLQRESSKPIRVTGLLVGSSALAADAGLSWLGGVLRNTSCTDCRDGELRYFITDPDICEVEFGEVAEQRRRSFGATGKDLIRYTFQPDDGVLPEMPANTRWSGSWLEGTVFSWGAVGPDGEQLELHGPVSPRRRNHVRNPTFTNDLAGWDVVAGSAWVAAGGVDNGAYLSVPPRQGTLAPYSTGTYGSGAFSAAAQPASMTTTEKMPGQVSASLALRGGLGYPVTVQLSNPSGPFATIEVTPGVEWTRYSLTGVSADAVVTLSAFSSGAFDLDHALLERSSAVLDYFDGNDVDDDYTIVWEGDPNRSISRRIWNGTASVVRDDSNFRPTIEIVAGGASALELNWDHRNTLTLDARLLPYERRMYRVACTEGVNILQSKDLGEAGAYIQVEFTLTAGNPTPYTLATPINTTPLTSAFYADPTGSASYDDLGWLSDPNAQVITRPPVAPVIINPAIETITVWTRYYVPIPATAIGDWTAAIPTAGLTSKANPITQVRVRFHPNPFNYPATAVDPLSYCGEFIVSYLPALTRLEVDGVLQSSTATRAGRAPANADHLLYGSDGAPITWPELACGTPYVMTIDIPPTTVLDSFSVDLALRKRA